MLAENNGDKEYIVNPSSTVLRNGRLLIHRNLQKEYSTIDIPEKKTI
jgi:hypothetical protein